VYCQGRDVATLRFLREQGRAAAAQRVLECAEACPELRQALEGSLDDPNQTLRDWYLSQIVDDDHMANSEIWGDQVLITGFALLFRVRVSD
jgi:hypothetical protein